MIETVWIENPIGDILELNLRSSDREEGLLIFNLEGLGPPKASINSSGGPNFDGVRVSSVGADARHLLMTLAVPGGGISEEEAKAKIYRFFPIKQEIVFGIKTDRKNVYIPAIVEENEYNQFAKVENAVISLFCPQPYFVDAIEQIVHIFGDSSMPLFEFPFENDSLITKELEFGYITEIPMADITYAGEVRTGLDITLEFSDYVNNVVIANTNGSQQMTLDFTNAETHFGFSVRDGDQVYINTRRGEKSIYFVRDTEWFNMINGVGINDDWIELLPGENIIIITAGVGIDYVETELRFRNLSEGV